MISVMTWSSPEAWERIKPPSFEDPVLYSSVEKIVKEVRCRGDQALIEFTKAFDGCVISAGNLRVAQAEIDAAYEQVSAEFLSALRGAKENILQFHNRQKQRDWIAQDGEGSITGQMYRPIGRVGLYIPGGTAKYPSSVLMTCIPAVVAGVGEIVMVTPPGKDGKIPAATLVSAAEAGVSEIYRIGGAQAIAALAYGTKTIRAVDKIVGPGNIYVTLAKKMVFGTVGIDMLAGPSEILIIGDGSVDAGYAAADMLSQAEHDVRARAMLVTPDAVWAAEVAQEIETQLAKLPRLEIAKAALANNGSIILVKDLAEAFEVANRVAPEHLELLLAEPWAYLTKVKNAGAIFLGPYSPEPLGDYWAGPNHVLPTGGSARYTSVLSVDDFCKRSSIINYTQKGLQKAAGAIAVLTKAEELTAHGAAVAIRQAGAR